MWWTVLISVLATLAVAFVAMNLMSGEKKIQEQLDRLYDTHDPQFRRSMSVLLGPPLLEGNRVQELLNGDQIFPAMLEAIHGAKRSITFETFIYWKGEIGDRFAEALAERARLGVKVHVLLDWVGSMKMEDRYLQQMKEAGVAVERYHKPHWSHLARLNQRTHRKVLVIDGHLGFTGGVGIADEWQGQAQDEDHWRDTHFRVEGPVVAQMQAVFVDNWIKATGCVLHGDDYFPALPPVGEQPAQMFSSSPTGGSESMHLMYLMAITSARETIHLSSSYFVPDSLAVQALVDARKRGVRVCLITPGRHIDTATVRRASRARWGPLLEAGVEIAEFQPTMFHCKVLVVDSLLVSVGSTNFDNRSFRLNDEANLNVLDAAFARRLIAVFEQDWQRAKQVSFQAWRHRPWREKLIEHAAALLRTQL
ncbi:cardiolipin synthase [uncultured Azohydromonas sp.]|jgi:Phosphatidylserine/phosphatidylglycerophosphate/cardiolipin synthases and related enzymes|uniref:cardiolipin synthase n=1 Tax=uncultured Azohydromonas sp. TaxID=487342 RepID=UPI002625BC3E|nr:cardiolipin synthase [uncultured Azohydromonas sp.]